MKLVPYQLIEEDSFSLNIVLGKNQVINLTGSVLKKLSPLIQCNFCR